MKRYNLFMDVDTLQTLKELADKQSSSVSNLIRDAVDRMLANYRASTETDPTDAA